MPNPTSLTVVRAFGFYWPGDVITDPALIAAILGGPNADKVRETGGSVITPPPPPPPTSGAVEAVSGEFLLNSGTLSARFGTAAGTFAQGNDNRFSQIGQPGPAGASVVFRGPWQPSTAYAALNMFTFSGRLYIVPTPYTSSGVFNPANAVLAADKGTDGIGTPGVSIVGGSINSSNRLILSLSNGSTFDAGLMPSNTFTLQPPTGSAIGGVKQGTNITIAGDGTIAAADGVALAATGTPAADGTAARGVAATAARSDHVHPTDSTRAPLRTPRAPITTAGAFTAADTDGLIVFAASVTGTCTLGLSATFTGPLTVDNRKGDTTEAARRVRITRAGGTIAGDAYADLDTGVITLIAGAGNDISVQG